MGDKSQPLEFEDETQRSLSDERLLDSPSSPVTEDDGSSRSAHAQCSETRHIPGTDLPLWLINIVIFARPDTLAP